MRIQSIQNNNIINVTKMNIINFKSNAHREAELRELRRLREERRQMEEQRRQMEEQKLLDRLKYPELDNPMSTRMAGFLSKFTCAIQNASEHNVMEFFGDEETASNLRKKLSPTCQADSKMLREEVQKMEEVKDPVMTLICANRMKKFTPKKGILSEEQHKNFVEGIKKTVSTIVRNSDLDKFEPDEKALILEIVQKVENSDSVDFGIEVKLKALVDKLNSKKIKLGFIPPVQVRNFLGEKIKKIMK